MDSKLHLAKASEDDFYNMLILDIADRVGNGKPLHKIKELLPTLNHVIGYLANINPQTAEKSNTCKELMKRYNAESPRTEKFTDQIQGLMKSVKLAHFGFITDFLFYVPNYKEEIATKFPF